MPPTTTTGLRVFVFTTPAAAAALAVATDTPLAMLLLGIPSAVVIYVLHQEHQPTHQTRTATAPISETISHTSAHSLPTRCPESPTLDDTTVSSQHDPPLPQALKNLDITPHDLWRRYRNDGGTVGELEIDAYLHNSFHLPPEECHRLIHTVNALLGHRTHPPQPTTQNQPGAEHADNHHPNVQD